MATVTLKRGMQLLLVAWLAAPLGACATPRLDLELDAAIAQAEAGGQWHEATRAMARVLDRSEPGSDTERAAVAALGEYGDGAAVAPLLAVARRGGSNTAEAVIDALARMPGRHATMAMAEEFESTGSAAERVLLLRALRDREPVVVLPLVVRALDSGDEELRSVALQAIDNAADAANALVQRGQADSAVALLRAAAAAADQEPPAGATTSQALGFLHHGWVAGPFRAESLDAGWEEQWMGDPAGSPFAPGGVPPEGWTAFDARASGGIVDLVRRLGAETDCFAYALLAFDSSTGRDALLRLGSDDGVAAWLNGEQVHENRTFRGVVPDSDVVPVRVREGRNVLVLKISQGAAGWGFCARLTTPEGWPLAVSQTEATP